MRKQRATLYDANGVKFDSINYDDSSELIRKIKKKYG